MGTLRMIAELMEVAARTAPKARGQDFVVTRILEGEVLKPLMDKMAEIGDRTQRKFFVRDSRNVAASEVVLLIGIKDAQHANLNCSACGMATCAELTVNSVSGEFGGPQCAFRVMDLGIALGSAAKMASMFNADNRIMYTIGVAARELSLIDADLVIGIPLAATGKSIYFDRPPVS
jgi:uncharacterized ferredoxin-like protein